MTTHVKMTRHNYPARKGNSALFTNRVTDNRYSTSRYSNKYLTTRYRKRHQDKRQQYITINIKTMSGCPYTSFVYPHDGDIYQLKLYIQQKIGNEGTPHDKEYLYDAGISLFIQGRANQIDGPYDNVPLYVFIDKKLTQDIFVMPRIHTLPRIHTSSAWGSCIDMPYNYHWYEVNELESFTNWPVRNEVSYELEGIKRYFSILYRLQYKYWAKEEKTSRERELDDYMNVNDYYNRDHDEYYDSDY